MPQQTKPKTSTHHTKDAKLIIKVRSSDLDGNPTISVENIQPAVDEFVFVRNVSKFSAMSISANGISKPKKSVTLYTSNNLYKVALWGARDIIDVLRDQNIAFEETLMVRELKGTTEPNASRIGSVLLSRLPQTLASLIPWIADDERRYLVVTTGARNDFPKQDRAHILRTIRGHTALMTDDEEQAITIKLKHGGSLFDMQELRAQT